MKIIKRRLTSDIDTVKIRKVEFDSLDYTCLCVRLTYTIIPNPTVYDNPYAPIGGDDNAQVYPSDWFCRGDINEIRVTRYLIEFETLAQWVIEDAS